MKKYNKYVRLLQTVAASGGALIVNTLITLLLVPVVTDKLGSDAYGFVTLGKNIAQYATMITAVLNSFAARYIVVAYHRENYREANIFFASTAFGDLILGTGLFAVSLAGICFLERLLVIPVQMVADVKMLFLFVFINFWIVTVSTAFAASAHIKNCLHIVGRCKTVGYVCEALVLAVCFHFFPAHVYYVGLGLAVASIVLAVANVWICRHYTPELRIKREFLSISAIGRLVLDGLWTSLNSLGDALNSGLDLLICNWMLTTAAMGQLAISKTFYSMFSSMFLLVGQAFEPLYLKSYAKGGQKTLLGEFRVAMKLSGGLSNVVFAGFLALGMSFYRLWIPGEDISLIYTLTVINNMITIPGGSMQPLYYIYTLTLKKKLPTIITICGGILNVAGMYVLIRYTSLGVYAVVWTTVLVMMMINFITNPLYMAHVLNMPWWTFYPAILKNLLSCAVLCAVFKGMSFLYVPETWLTLILSALILAVVGLVLHLLIVCSKDDWEMLEGRIRKRHTT